MATEIAISVPSEKVNRSNFRNVWLYLLRHWRHTTVEFYNPGTSDIFCKYVGRHGRIIKAGTSVKDVFYLGKSYQHAIDKYNLLLDDISKEVVVDPPEETEETPKDSGGTTS